MCISNLYCQCLTPHSKILNKVRLVPLLDNIVCIPLWTKRKDYDSTVRVMMFA